MSLVAVILLIISAVFHATWNLFCKRECLSAAFFLAANIFGCLVLVPVVFLYGSVLAEFPVRVWLLVTVTGLCLGIYYTALSHAYSSGDMSIVYPLARSSPIIVVTIVTIFLGKYNEVSTQCILGIIMVVGGSFLLPMKHFNDFRLKNYRNVTCVFALVAALGSAGYSIIDDEILRCLRNNSAIGLGTVKISILYTFVHALSCSLWLSIFVVFRKSGREDFRQILQNRKLFTFLTGGAIYVTYSMVLISLAFVRNVSYVVAFRQISIPLGTALGILVLRESRYLPKIIGVVVIFIGLVLVGLG